jgi:hypothetical protein
MWVVFGSEALHLIWLKMEYKEYKDKIQHKTKLLEELIERIENGEKITSGMKEEIKMVLMNKHTEAAVDDDIDDDYLDKCRFLFVLYIYKLSNLNTVDSNCKLGDSK